MFCRPFLKLSEPVASPKRSAMDAAAQKLVSGCAPKLQCSPQGSRWCRRRSGEQSVATVWRFAELMDPPTVRRVPRSRRNRPRVLRQSREGLWCTGECSELSRKARGAFRKNILGNVTKCYKMLQTLPIFRGLFSGIFRDFCQLWGAVTFALLGDERCRDTQRKAGDLNF